MEEIDQSLGHHRTDPFDRGQFGLRIRPRRRHLKPSIEPNAFIRSFAVTMPTWRIPSPNRKRAG